MRAPGARLVATGASRAGRGAARGRGGDLVAGWGQGEPTGAEGVYAFPIGVSGLLILDEEVDRVAVVSDLRSSVGAGGGPEQGGVRPLPTAGWPVARSGGQAVAQAPVQVLVVPVSFWNRYRVRPWELTRIWPRPVLATPTVAGCPAGVVGRCW